MKKFFTSTLVISTLLLCHANISFAEGDNGGGSNAGDNGSGNGSNTGLGSITNNPITIIPSKPKPGKGPKTPSRQQIECWYDGEELAIDFVIPEGICTLYVTDYATGFITPYTFDSSDHADIYVGVLLNGGTLEIQTENGHSYYGEIIVE